MPLAYAPDIDGAPLVGGLLYFYASGTATPLDTFSDDTLSTPNTNPVVADAHGFFPPIFLQEASYKVVLQDANNVEIWTQDPVSPFIPSSSSSPTQAVIELTVDGNQSVPLVGVCGDLFVPFDCTITAAVLQANLPGSVVVDIWAAPFVTNTPPTAAESITASDPPTLATSVSSYDSTLTGWDTDIAANTALRFNIVSIDTITRFTLSLVVTIAP
jgi:hypothetical protein